MNQNKVSFIVCANDESELQECQYYLEHLVVPQEIETELLCIWNASSMTSGYQEGMIGTDAKYKVYLHQDTFIINPNFIADMLAIFRNNPQIGMMGCIGSRKLEVAYGNLPVGNYDVGTVFHNLVPPYINHIFSEKEYVPVEIIDGFLMVTQVDIPWREDLFQGWDFYDCSQSMEMQKNGKKVVVPYQQMPWCYHDNKANNMKAYYRDYEIFLKEYFGDVKGLEAPVGKGFLELKQSMDKLKTCMDSLLEKGERNAFVAMFQDREIRSLRFFREYCIVADIEESENGEFETNRFWDVGLSKDEIIEKLRVLKHIVKRLEYDVEEGTEYAYLREHYSDIAISMVIQEYVWDKDKIKKKILTQCL